MPTRIASIKACGKASVHDDALSRAKPAKKSAMKSAETLRVVGECLQRLCRTFLPGGRIVSGPALTQQLHNPTTDEFYAAIPLMFAMPKAGKLRFTPQKP
jgi:hypothetical protein